MRKCNSQFYPAIVLLAVRATGQIGVVKDRGPLIFRKNGIQYVSPKGGDLNV